MNKITCLHAAARSVHEIHVLVSGSNKLPKPSAPHYRTSAVRFVGEHPEPRDISQPTKGYVAFYHKIKHVLLVTMSKETQRITTFDFCEFGMHPPGHLPTKVLLPQLQRTPTTAEVRCQERCVADV